MAKITKAQQARNRQLWVEALKSGKYKQTIGVLHKIRGKQESFCCLGVACKLAAENGVKLTTELRNDGTEKIVKYTSNKKVKNSWNDGYSKDSQECFLPKAVIEWLGTAGDLVEVMEFKDTKVGDLVDMNDAAKATFKQIAKVVEEGKIKLL